jgi:ABC-2 type transport system ATP-binding protein
MLYTVLEIVKIEKKYGLHQILNLVNIELKSGIYWLKGVNGSGKSTLLRILSGLIPFKGDVKLSGRYSIIRQPVAYRRLINYAEAEPQFPSFLTGNELVDFVASQKQGDDRQRALLTESLGISDYLNQPVASYSSGMLKKLALLLAFTGKPSWILLDEPLTTLDQQSQELLCDLIMRAAKIDNISFIITSHHDIMPGLINFDKILFLKDQHLYYS